MDVFAYPANPNIRLHNNTRPTKFFEYIGSEIPFIATKCDGLKMISDGKGFSWVDYSAEDLINMGAKFILKNPRERVRLSRELHELKKEHTWKSRADRLHDIIVKHLSEQERIKDGKP